MTRRRAASALSALAIIAAACGAPPAAQEPSPTPSAPARAPAAPTPSPSPTPIPTWPLTGLQAPDGTSIHRRPLNVRIPNDPNARPQYGFAKADLVFELIVEGGVTRYSVVYQSKDADNVGPVRSYRYSDLHLTEMLRGVLVASGATIEERDAVTRAVRAGNFLSVDDQRAPKPYPYYRVNFRTSPNNLFVNLVTAREAAKALGADNPVDVPPLRFLTAGERNPEAGGFAGATTATSLTIPFLRWPTTFKWDDAAKGWRRWQQDIRTVDAAANEAILAKNVIVMWTNIWSTSTVEDNLGSLGLDYALTGGGQAAIFRDGRRQDGTWSRPGPLDQFSFFNKAGEPIALAPGQSWIHFVYPTWVVTTTP